VRAIVARRADDIVLGHDAQNTIGNAEETSRWVKMQGYESIRLVTSDYHMPRSLEEFSYTLPDVSVVPEPVVGDRFSLYKTIVNTESRLLLMSEYHKYLAARLRHVLLNVVEPA
jgi:uncharacterized SAM-binding protein YcdF (DUF218 family)